MLTLETLPRDVLEVIVRLANSLPPPDSSLSERKSVPIQSNDFVPGIPEWQRERIIKNRNKRARRTIAPLLLCSRLLHDMTLEVLLNFTTFQTRSTPDLARLVHILGDDKIEHIQNLYLTLYSDDDYEHKARWCGEDTVSEAAIDGTASLMARLPSRLRRLGLTMPYHPWPFFSTNRQTDWRLRRALDRFNSLVELDLDCVDHWIHIDMFTNLTAYHYSDFSMDNRPATEKPSPKFHMLRRLRLQGCLTPGLCPRGLAKALSEDHLPALEALVLVGILTEEEDEAILSPEAFQGMHPLREFQWEPYDGIRKTLGNPHQVLSKRHFDILREKHGDTLRVLKVEIGLDAWGGWLADFKHDGDVTQEYFDWFKGTMPRLELVELSM